MWRVSQIIWCGGGGVEGKSNHLVWGGGVEGYKSNLLVWGCGG